MEEHTDLTKELADELIPPEATGGDDDIDAPEELEQWKEETKGIERIISVTITTSTPRTAEWIADQALVAEKTARDHLEMFADLGVVASFTSSGVTRYHVDEAFLHYREVSRCVEEHSKDEITGEIEEIQQRISEIKGEYEVETSDEIRAKAAGDGVEIEDVREYKKAAADWEMFRDRLDVLEDAARRFDKFERMGRVRV